MMKTWQSAPTLQVHDQEFPNEVKSQGAKEEGGKKKKDMGCRRPNSTASRPHEWSTLGFTILLSNFLFFFKEAEEGQRREKRKGRRGSREEEQRRGQRRGSHLELVSLSQTRSRQQGPHEKSVQSKVLNQSKKKTKIKKTKIGQISTQDNSRVARIKAKDFFPFRMSFDQEKVKQISNTLPF